MNSFLWQRRVAQGQRRVGRGLGSQVGGLGVPGDEIHLSLCMGINSWMFH